jgi:glycosyltransferase involved in cell wall biosynthesis
VRICLLTQTRIADDPRVRRQGDALVAAGHDVVGVGLSGASSSSPDWPVLEVPGPSRTPHGKVTTGLRTQLARAGARAALRVYWSFSEHRVMLETARRVGADVYHANDWRVLPVAATCAAGTGGSYVYDSHEFAVEENVDQLLWRLVFPHYVREIEAYYIHGAAFVSTVGDGIADLLQEVYALRTRPLVVRNVPAYQETPYRPPGARMVVLYHGVYNPDRGLEDLVASVADWRDEFALVIRGYGAPAYEARLRDTAAGAGVGDRVVFEPPVPMTDLVPRANEADIGIHTIPVTNRQTRYCLPNKLFEYVMAGLAVCVTNAPEMARIVKEYECGVVIHDSSSAGIATAVNALTRDSVARFKRASLKAATSLNWDHEQERLQDAYSEVERKHVR